MIIADTGYWIALSDKNDSFYQRAVSISKEIEEPLITTCPVLTEVCHLLLSRRGILSMLRFLDLIFSGGCEIFELSVSHISKIHGLAKKYRELPMDLADASLVILAEHLGHGRILTTDQRDFKTYHWKEKKPFQNLLSDND